MSKKPIEIRNMFVSMIPDYGKEIGAMYDIAILTPNDQYIEYEFRFCYNRMTHVAYNTIKSLLVDYRFTNNSEVCMTDNIPHKNPLYMYLAILAQQIEFNICHASIKKISDRLCGITWGIKKRITDDRELTRPHIATIWNYLVESGKCGWVTPAYNDYIFTLNSQQRRRKKLVRIGAYYMRLRRLKYQYTLRSKLKALEKNQNKTFKIN